MTRQSTTQMLDEMKLFASFSAAEQRFIRRSLDVGLERGGTSERWARNACERSQIDAQVRRYRMIRVIKACIPDDLDPEAAECFMGPMITLTAGDLAEGRILDFEAYRFLYERLLGASVRPWLVSVFCAAATMPVLDGQLRKELLQSLPVQDVATAGWSIHAPLFVPEWVEKVEEAVN